MGCTQKLGHPRRQIGISLVFLYDSLPFWFLSRWEDSSRGQPPLTWTRGAWRGREGQGVYDRGQGAKARGTVSAVQQTSDRLRQDGWSEPRTQSQEGGCWHHTAWVDSCLYYLLTRGPRTCCLTCLSLSFLIWKMDIIRYQHRSVIFCADKMS